MRHGHPDRWGPADFERQVPWRVQGQHVSAAFEDGEILFILIGGAVSHGEISPNKTRSELSDVRFLDFCAWRFAATALSLDDANDTAFAAPTLRVDPVLRLLEGMTPTKQNT